MITEPVENTQTQTIVSNSDDIHSWANWTPGIVDHHRSKKRIVWIDYTADWWTTCILNEKRVFSNNDVVDLVLSNNVSKIKIDYSKERAAEKKEWDRTNKATIPLMIIYPANPDRPGIFLEGTVSPADAIKALKYAIKYS